jgi:hypothetical protein
MRIRFLVGPLSCAAVVAALSIAPAAAANQTQVPPPEPYPSDVCVAEKLQATAQYCLAALAPKPNLDQAKARLAGAWSAAEAKSLEAGVACTETTATAEEVAAALDASGAAIAGAIAESTAPDAKAERRCESSRQHAAALACSKLLQAESVHMKTRGVDRTRERLDQQQTLMTAWLEKSWSSGQARVCSEGPSAEEAVALVDAAADEAARLLYVSPRVSTEWTRIDPGAEVAYGEKTLAPTCGDGAPWSFFVKRGTVNKTVMYYEGGGACWSYLTCSLPTYKTGVGGGPAGASTGFADLNDERNPFKDWNLVFVPYCTGDVHWGDAVVDHTQGQGQNQRTITIRHKGFVNAQVAEKWAREHFSNPEQVFVTGSSAGAYGAAVNSLSLMEYVWPSSDFAVLGDAGNGVIPDDFLLNHLPKWGIEQNLPDWIPGLNVPLSELNAADLWSVPALFYPDHRFANYTTAYDGGQGGQVGFYQVMLHPLGGVDWLFWWRPSCEWNSIMRGLVQDAAAAAPNYRYFIGSGSRHTMWGNDKVYADTTGEVPLLVDWVTAMLGDTPDWTNVESTDPGLLLPGDPRPSPTLEDPYYPDDGGRIYCE